MKLSHLTISLLLVSAFSANAQQGPSVGVSKQDSLKKQCPKENKEVSKKGSSPKKTVEKDACPKCGRG